MVVTSGLQGVMDFFEMISQATISYGTGWLGIIGIALVIIYIGGVLHKKLPEQRNWIWSLLLVLGTVVAICAFVIYLGNTTEIWVSAIFGLTLGVYYFDRVK